MNAAKKKPLNPRYPNSTAGDEISHAVDLIRTARLALHAGISPGLITDADIASVGYVLTYALDALVPAWKAVEEAGI